MESIDPFLQFLFKLRLGLKSGRSLVDLIPELAVGESDFEIDLRYWWQLFQINPDSSYFMKTDHRKVLQSILLVGFQGGSIFASICVLEEDIKMELEQNRVDYNERLKFKLMLPLLLLVFPALLIIMLGPTLDSIYWELVK